MKFSGAPHLLCLLALSGCAPEVIDLAMFGADAGASSVPEAASPIEEEEEELDAGPSPGAMDAGPDRDTGTTQAEHDARARGDAERSGGCTTKEDCEPGQVCNIVGCGPSRRGTCEAADECDHDDFKPVCGCDGYKYFNDCVRREHGVGLDMTCSSLRPPCTSSCPPTPTGAVASCSMRSQRSNGVCRQSTERACYVLPDTCPTIGFSNLPQNGEVYSLCNQDWSGAAVTGGWEICVPACQAIKAQFPFAQTSVQRCWGGAPPPRMGGGAGGPGFP